MGNLLCLLGKEDELQYDQIFVNFEDAQPTACEWDVYVLLQDVLTEARSILNELGKYEGATEEIRNAISNPHDELLTKASWNSVSICVSKLKLFFEFSQRMEQVVPKLLTALCCGPMTPQDHLKTQQALVKQFAEIIDFIMKFDDLKQNKPEISNDIAYFRRTMSRAKQNSITENESNIEQVSVEVINVMSLFFAHPTPMLNTLSSATSKFLNSSNLPIESSTEMFSTMTRVCQKILDNPEFRDRFQNKSITLPFILRVTVGLIILLDHTSPEGAFSKTSHTDVKNLIKILKEEPSSEENLGLLNCLRYSTKTLKYDSTPKHVKTLLNVT